MKTITRPLLNLHVAPDDWTIERYVRNAAQTALLVWIGFTAVSATGGILMRDTGAWFGEFRLYTYYTVFLLATCAVVCRHCSQVVPHGARSLWNLMSVGFAFLAADDLFLIHENIDKLVHWTFGADAKDHLTKHLDDLIVLVYGIIGAVIVWRRRSEVLNLRYFVGGMVTALALLLIMVFLDATGGTLIGVNEEVAVILEESTKGLGASAFFVTLVAARIQLRRRSEAPMG